MIAASSVSTQTSFEAAFGREYPAVVTVAYRVLGDRADAEDVAQDLFARFVGRRVPDPPVLRLAAARAALNVLRGRRRRVARELAEFRLQAALVNGAVSAYDPSTIVERSTRQALVRAALLNLRPSDAVILALRYGGATYRDLAQTMRIDVAQVGMKLSRAERAFRMEIGRVFER